MSQPDGPDERPRRLVIVTHNSNVFLQHELDAASEVFDEVHVLGWGATGPELRLRPNVRVLGFHEIDAPLSKGQQVRLALSPRFLGPFLRVAWSESRGGRLLKHFWLFWWFCTQGARIAALPGLRQSIAAPDRRVTLLSFWAIGPALAIPWLPPPSEGTVLRLHSADIYEWLLGYLPMRRWLYARADLLLFASRHGRDYVVDRYPELRLSDKSDVVFLGSADHGAGPVPIPGRETVVVTCSSFTVEKRLSRLAEALREWNRPLRWIHFGSGPLEAEVRNIIARSTTTTIDFRGQIDHEEIMRFYTENAVDVFVNVSDREAVAVSICEALSFGIPVVATAVGGSPDIVGEALGSGVLIPAEFDTGDLLDALERVVSRRRIGFDPRSVWSRCCDACMNSQRTARELLAVQRGRRAF